MPFAFCVYGHLAGLTAAEIASCRTVLAQYEVQVDGHVIDFVHEGHFIDVDSDLDALLPLLSFQARGVIDIINHHDWEMFRCSLKDGSLTRTKVALDNALDTAYATERRS